jgi:tetrapyrrole methylase family protein/MazG family protein
MTGTTFEITVVGLGPGDPGLLTQQAATILSSGRVFLRTRIHPFVESMPQSAGWTSFDDLYEQRYTFEDVSSAIVESLLRCAESESIVYAVPGHPLFGEATVRRLIETARDRDVTIRVVPGVSFLDTSVAALCIDAVDNNIQLVDALELAAVTDQRPYAGGKLPISPLRPALVAQMYSPAIASAVKTALTYVYPEDHQVTLLIATGTSEQELRSFPLVDLDRMTFDHLSTLFVPASDPLVFNRVSDGLQQIVARLRAPGGCPWDREQTHESLMRHMAEEAYELIEAVEDGSLSDLAEELGDVLLQVYLHAQIAEEAGDFSLEDVIQALSSKLVRRHPHVFGNRTIATSGDVIKAWDQIKQEERSEKNGRANESLFSSIPRSLPSLARSQTVLRRARSLGLNIDVSEHGDPSAVSPEERIAKMLAQIVDEADRVGIDAEQALRRWTSTAIERAENAAGREG